MIPPKELQVGRMLDTSLADIVDVCGAAVIHTNQRGWSLVACLHSSPLSLLFSANIFHKADQHIYMNPRSITYVYILCFMVNLEEDIKWNLFNIRMLDQGYWIHLWPAFFSFVIFAPYFFKYHIITISQQHMLKSYQWPKCIKRLKYHTSNI